jgi:hypothetical protein
VYSTPVQNSLVQLSAGLGSGGRDAVFALDSKQQLWEYVRFGNSFASPQLIGSHIEQISGSAVSPDTVFAISANAAHSTYEYHVSAPGFVFQYALGLPPSSGGPYKATQISAGTDGAGQASVFVNFNGVVYEATGVATQKHWTKVAGVNLSAPHSPLLTPFAIRDISASQVQGDTVFAVTYDLPVFGPGGSLTEYVGHITGKNHHLVYTAHLVASGVTQVSAGTDGAGHATVFALSTQGSLDEYTYQFFPFVLPHFGYSKAHVADAVQHLDGSQIQGDTVYYGDVLGVGATLYEHSPQGTSLDYVCIG